jgi:hypothetical protein
VFPKIKVSIQKRTLGKPARKEERFCFIVPCQVDLMLGRLARDGKENFVCLLETLNKPFKAGK